LEVTRPHEVAGTLRSDVDKIFVNSIRHIIVHYHIFKNAGSTLRAILERNFGPHFASFDSAAYDQRIRPEQLIAYLRTNPNIAAISSHHLRPPVPQIKDIQFHEILILRDPLDRIRSMYDFYRRADTNKDPLTHEAKRLGIREFLTFVLETRPNLIINSQLNLVANGGAKIPEPADLTKAATVVKSAHVVGVAERFDTFALLAERYFRPFFPHLNFSYVPENVSPGRSDDLRARLNQFAAVCGQELYDRLWTGTELDRQLVQIAATECLQRAQNNSITEEDLRRFHRRVLVRKGASRIMYQTARIPRLCWRALGFVRRLAEPSASNYS